VKLLNWSAILQSQQKDSRGIIALEASGDKFSYDFNCTIAAEPILEGPGGVNAKGPLPGEASYYYSMIRMPTSGHVSIGGKTFDVAGPTWMDHEFSSNPLGADQVGWDWMGLTLDDGRDVMVYRLRNASGGSAFASATIAERDGRVKYLDGSKIHLTGSEPWRSPSTGGVYPQRWHVALDGIDAMDVRTMVTDQEMHTPNSTNVDYYEGASDVLDAGGRKMGQGYLEMTGYAKPLNGM
jgi:predicted secreted hydrolase